MKVVIFTFLTVFGWVGWEVAGYFTDDLFIAFILSGLGSFLGIFAGFWTGQHLDLG